MSSSRAMSRRIRARRSSVESRTRFLSDSATDVAVAATSWCVAVLALLVTNEPEVRVPDAGAYLLIAMAAAPLAWRRTRPVSAVAGTSLVTLVYFAVGYPGGPVTFVLLVAIYSAAATGHRGSSLTAITVFAGGGVVFRATVDGEPLVEVALNATLFVLVYLLGDAVESRRSLREEARRRIEREQQEREREAQRRVVEERMRIARELHDIVAHTVSAMTVHAGVAEDMLDDRPDDARQALRTVRATARSAMAELRATVSVLREDVDDHLPLASHGLSDLHLLLDAVADDDLAVDLDVAGSLDGLPTTVDVTAYRIVQEALTNVVRHARASRVLVAVHRQADALEIEVVDDGRGDARASGVVGAAEPGYGLVGMRERAEALDGTLIAGTPGSGGFRVWVRLPIERQGV